MRIRLLLLLLLIARISSAQEVSTAIVPVVGSVFGATMARWKTDVEIVNDTGRDLDVGLELPSAPGSPFILLTLSAGQTQRFTDIAGQAFGLDQVLSPLRITTAGPRSVSVRASVYAISGGTLTSEPLQPGISSVQPLSVYFGNAFYTTRILDDLAFSEEYRTNIGLVNLGERDAEFVLALQRIPGRAIAVTRLRLAPGTITHNSIQSLFPLITEGTGFSVLVETLTPQTYVYGSVVESASQSGRFVAARIGTR